MVNTMSNCWDGKLATVLEKESWSLYSQKDKETAMLTPQYPLIKAATTLIIFFSNSFNSIFLPQMKNVFFPSSPVLVQAFNNTYIILWYLTKTGPKLKDVKKHSCSCNHVGAAAAVWCQELSRAVKCDSKDKRTPRCYQHEKILYSEKEWLFLLRAMMIF